METLFLCPDCTLHHAGPADALLGHLILCLECAMLREYLGDDIDVVPDGCLIAA